MKLIELSQELVRQARNGVVPMNLVEQVAQWDRSALEAELDTDLKRKVFWINIYNSCVVIIARKMGDFDRSYFSKKMLEVAGVKMSFDQIEHGLLRKSKLKYTFGYLPCPFTRTWERKWRLKKRDYRIHFALNCGANSCPPIAIYSCESLENELNLAMRYYLEETTLFETEKRQLKVPRLFLWYFADFGGFEGIRNIYKRAGLISLQASPRIGFLNYDWTLNIDNFTS
ncbi:DUF547 domain-containing protein [bacterium SCSIO 12741]|nr:DUF547 domain-containing protein [bacterium SCSIO 12741]